MSTVEYTWVRLRCTSTPRALPDAVLLGLDVAGERADEAYRLRFTLADAQRVALALLEATAVQRYRVEVAESLAISDERARATGSEAA